MNVAQMTVEKLKTFGVARVYGLIGTSVLDLLDALSESGIRYISTRHDQAAVSMAVAEGKVTGRAGVAVVHGGPGFLNSLTAVAVAYKDCIPVVVISGAVKRRLRGLDSWLEVDQMEIIKTMVKSSFSIQKPSEADSSLSKAYYSASSPPYGPVFVEVPEDVWRLECGTVKESGAHMERKQPAKAEVEKALELLKKSHSPIILAGGGINDSEGASLLLKFLERFQIPVATTGNGRGALPEDHELSLGRAGYGGGSTLSDNLLAKSDFVLSLGAGLSDVTTYAYNFLPRGEIVVVMLDPLVGNKPVPYGMISSSDARVFLKMMLETKESYSSSVAWRKEINEERSKWNSLLVDISSRTPTGTVNPSKFFSALNLRLPRDVIISAGQGLHILYAYAYLKIKKCSSFLAATNLGAMGYAFPAALGAKTSLPETLVVSILGDGEFLMTLPDLETAVREKIGVRIIIVNDNSYRVLYMRQRIQKMGRVFGTKHTNPDIAKLAEAYGIEGMVLNDDSKIDSAVDFLLKPGEAPRILELQVDPEDLPPFNVEASLTF